MTDRTLSVRGFGLDDLSSVSEVHPAGLMLSYIIRQWRQLVTDTSYEHAHKDMKLAFKRTVTGLGHGGESGWASLKSDNGFDLFSSPSDQPDQGMRYLHSECAQAIGIRCANGRFGFTTSGLIGLFPAVAQAGDEVCIFEGCAQCYVLRRKTRQETYEFVGECYVHGVMHGEALTDKYPQHKSSVWFDII